MKIFHYLQKTIVNNLNRFFNKIEQVSLLWQKRKVIKILSSSETPHSYDSDYVFERLQNVYGLLPEYAYDSFSTWKRGVQRLEMLLERFEYLRQPGLSVLEVGCGDGMAGHAFHVYGHNVDMVDKEDWREPRAKNLPFICRTLSKQLPLDSDYYDFVYSFNTFEHVDNPETTFKETVRVCKPGGYIYLEFGPLYASPWGLHAHETLRMPYSQFLFSENFVNHKLKELGVFDLGKKSSTLQPLNKWKVKDFLSLWDSQECKVVWSNSYVDLTHLNVIVEHSKAFVGRDLTIDDVTTQALYVTLLRTERVQI
jgi:ubiquinone/menaquinone biosynthesis C-methylase UbiE